MTSKAGSKLSPMTMKSSPAPPSTVSSPLPVVMRSLPLSPTRLSFSLAPMIASAPSPPLMVLRPRLPASRKPMPRNLWRHQWWNHQWCQLSDQYLAGICQHQRQADAEEAPVTLAAVLMIRPSVATVRSPLLMTVKLLKSVEVVIFSSSETSAMQIASSSSMTISSTRLLPSMNSRRRTGGLLCCLQRHSPRLCCHHSEPGNGCQCDTVNSDGSRTRDLDAVIASATNDGVSLLIVDATTLEN